jgi:hypothetical protein
MTVTLANIKLVVIALAGTVIQNMLNYPAQTVCDKDIIEMESEEGEMSAIKDIAPTSKPVFNGPGQSSNKSDMLHLNLSQSCSRVFSVMF